MAIYFSKIDPPSCEVLRAKIPDFEGNILESSLGYFPKNCYLTPVSNYYPSVEAMEVVNQLVNNKQPEKSDQLSDDVIVNQFYEENHVPMSAIPDLINQSHESVIRSESVERCERIGSQLSRKSTKELSVSKGAYVSEVEILFDEEIEEHANSNSIEVTATIENDLVDQSSTKQSSSEFSDASTSEADNDDDIIDPPRQSPWPPVPPRSFSVQARKPSVTTVSTGVDQPLEKIDGAPLRTKGRPRMMSAPPRREVIINPNFLPHFSPVDGKNRTSVVIRKGFKINHSTQTKIPLIYTAVIQSMHSPRRRSKKVARKSLEEMTCVEAFRHGISRTAKFVFSSIGLCGLLVIYLIIGAYSFAALEYAMDLEIRNQLITNRSKFITNVATGIFTLMTNRSEECSGQAVTIAEGGYLTVCWNQTDAQQVVSQMLMLYNNEVNKITNNGAIKITESKLNSWELQDSFLYAVAVITTIGYGNLVPNTTGGRVLTIIYALIGVPLMLITLANMGHFLGDFVRFVYQHACQPLLRKLRRHVFCRYCHANASNNLDNTNQPKNKKKSDTSEVVQIPILVTLFILASYMLGIAAIFHEWEGWSWEEAFYFCFITFTTIGFGDYVPGSSISTERTYQVVLTSMSVLFGLVIVSMGFNLMQDAVASFFKACWTKIGMHHRKQSDNQNAVLEQFVSDHNLMDDPDEPRLAPSFISASPVRFADVESACEASNETSTSPNVSNDNAAFEQ